MIGWASAPFDGNWAFRHPKRAAWMALAGPAANVACVLAAALLIRVGMEWGLFEIPFRLASDSIALARDPESAPSSPAS